VPNVTVSIIIVTLNSAKYLSRCFEALSRQTVTNFEVIVVDNGSSDRGLANLVTDWPGVSLRIEYLPQNLGFAVANNVGAHLARGHWLALLNADAFPEPDWLERFLEVAETMPDAFFASRQIQANTPTKLDGEGDTYHISGLAWRRNYGLPVREKCVIEEIFSPCAAAAFYPRQAFLNVGGFDEDYFAYQEDVDLGFRLRLKGLHCYYVSQAVVHHVGSVTFGKYSDFAIYYGHRNLVWTYVKNMPAPLLWIFLPLHLVANLLTMFRFLSVGHGKAIWRAKVDAIHGLAPMLGKRKNIQQDRQASIKAIYRAMEHDLLAPFRASVERRYSSNKY
jgi:GT2 family glycosyltransferase